MNDDEKMTMDMFVAYTILLTFLDELGLYDEAMWRLKKRGIINPAFDLRQIITEERGREWKIA